MEPKDLQVHTRVGPIPVLYSFRRCPYAIRARMALAASGVAYETVEVSLRDKPARLIELSPKATVPVLVLPGDVVLDESLDIMRWALGQSDGLGWLARADKPDARQLLHANDTTFKYWLDRYKYPARYPGEAVTGREARHQAVRALISPLNHLLEIRPWLGGEQPSLEDVAIFPFVRQFACVEPAWFQSQVPQAVRDWLAHWLQSELFARVMQKNPAP